MVDLYIHLPLQRQREKKTAARMLGTPMRNGWKQWWGHEHPPLEDAQKLQREAARNHCLGGPRGSPRRFNVRKVAPFQSGRSRIAPFTTHGETIGY